MNQANDKDPEKLSNTLWSYHRVRRTKRKFSHFVREAFNKFSEMVDRLIKSGVLNRLFGQYDFFSEQDRDSHSPRSAHLRKLRHRPAKCGQRIDDFGEVKWDFEFARDQNEDSSASESSSSAYDSDSDANNKSGEDEMEFIG